MAGLVWSREPGRQLAGFFPVRIDRHRYGVPIPVLVSWTHPYATLGTPLVHRDMVEPVIAAWLEHIAQDPELPDLVLVRFLAEEGPVAAALASVLARNGCEARSFDRHHRALLAPGENRDGYFERTMSAKRRKELRRQKRRLDELGAVTVAEADSSDMSAAVDDFLALEAAGWKGRAGTAAMHDEDVLDFMRHAVTALKRENKVSIHRLLLDGDAIAAAITLKSGTTAWGWKIAYDESYAPYSPGVLLISALTEAFLAGTAIARVDSCATATHAMINQLWGERLAMTDCLITTRPGTELSFAFASRLEALRRTAIAAAKSLRDHLRPR
jgi:hypothetical protein